MTPQAARDRWLELLADRASQGLDPGEQAELEQLSAAFAMVDDGTVDLAAASIDLACEKALLPPMPQALVARLEASAAGLVGPQMGPPPSPATVFMSTARTVPMGVPGPGPPVVPAPVRPLPAEPPARAEARPIARRDPVRWVGWLAAAACLVLAALGWLTADRARRELAARPEVPAKPSLTDERNRLAGAPGTLRVEWTKTDDPAGRSVSGDVVWNAAEQRGFMRFRGLAPNDATANQYQLWIFDKTRDERYPIDGGVFDVGVNGEDVIVPIAAKLHVDAPTLFAVTLERPGGVVVSSRERLVTAARVGG